MKKAILNKYALNGYTVHSNLPIGTVIPSFANTTPVGFLNCDHTKIKKSDYPELWDRLKDVPMCQSEETEYFYTPDLREVSLVGIGENGTLDISAHDIYDVGQFKDDQLQGHWHEFNSYRAQRGASSPYECFDDYTNPPSIVTRDNKVQNAITDGTNGTPRTGTTTHGKQVGVRWIIKATQYATVEQNAIDDTKFTTGNVLSAQKIAQYINDQNELSDIETISVSATPTIMNYDGVIYATQDGSGNHSIYVNDVLLYISVNFDCILIKKGDTVRVSGNSISNVNARFYKKRDYSQR